MSKNKLKTEPIGGLLHNRLALVLSDLNEKFSAGDLSAMEDVQEEFVMAMNRFVDEPYSPFFQATPVRPGDYPQGVVENTEKKDLGDDIVLLTKELKQLQDILMNNFNIVSRQESQVLEGIRRVRSGLGDLKLYGTGTITKNTYFGDSFGTLDRIDLRSELLTEKEVAIQPEEGIVTLGYEVGEIQRARVSHLSLNAASNGRLGDRKVAKNIKKTDTSVAFDGSADTWFEYELLTLGTEDVPEEPLVFDATVVLANEFVCNKIVINPHHFGTKNWMRLRTLETSLDGLNWTSIMDDIPRAEWTVDEDGTYTFAPEDSKYAGQAFFTFLPRKIKFLRVVIEQQKWYTVQGVDLNGHFRGYSRYAIGIRDIDILGIKYSPKSQMISKRIDLDRDIKKLGVLSNQNPSVHSPLIEIQHAISIDDGLSWHTVNPLDRNNIDRDEVLTFNLGPDSIQNLGEDNSISPIKSFRYRGTLIRNSEAFSHLAASPTAIRLRKSELLPLPQGGSTKLVLEERPETIVSVVRPLVGTVGTFGNPYLLGMTQAVTEDGRDQIFTTPISLNSRWDGSNIVGAENVRVGNEVWTKAPGNSWPNATDKVYLVNYTRNQILLGDGSANSGRAPDPGLPITVYLDPEPLTFTSIDGAKATLNFAHDGVKSNMRLRIRKEIVSAFTHIIPANAITFDLPKGRELTSASINGGWAAPAGGTAPDYGFIDGQIEFIGGGGDEFTVDVENGTLYFSSPTPQTDAGELTLTYSYKPYRDLKEEEFMLDGPTGIRLVSVIDQFEGATPVVAGERAIDLFTTLVAANEIAAARGSILPGSLRVPVTAAGIPPRNGATDVYQREVAFIDGREEFERDEAAAGTDGLYSIDYKRGILYSAIDSDAFAGGPFVFFWTDYTLEYGIGAEIRHTVVDNQLNLDQGDIIEVFKDTLLNTRAEKMIRVEYDYVGDQLQTLQDIEPFYSPILRDYAIIVVPVDETLGDIT